MDRLLGSNVEQRRRPLYEIRPAARNTLEFGPTRRPPSPISLPPAELSIFRSPAEISSFRGDARDFSRRIEALAERIRPLLLRPSNVRAIPATAGAISVYNMLMKTFSDDPAWSDRSNRQTEILDQLMWGLLTATIVFVAVGNLHRAWYSSNTAPIATPPFASPPLRRAYMDDFDIDYEHEAGFFREVIPASEQKLIKFYSATHIASKKTMLLHLTTQSREWLLEFVLHYALRSLDAANDVGSDSAICGQGLLCASEFLLYEEGPLYGLVFDLPGSYTLISDLRELPFLPEIARAMLTTVSLLHARGVAHNNLSLFQFLMDDTDGKLLLVHLNRAVLQTLVNDVFVSSFMTGYKMLYENARDDSNRYSAVLGLDMNQEHRRSYRSEIIRALFRTPDATAHDDIYIQALRHDLITLAVMVVQLEMRSVLWLPVGAPFASLAEAATAELPVLRITPTARALLRLAARTDNPSPTLLYSELQKITEEIGF
jgi:hypothetical protein